MAEQDSLDHCKIHVMGSRKRMVWLFVPLLGNRAPVYAIYVQWLAE